MDLEAYSFCTMLVADVLLSIIFIGLSFIIDGQQKKRQVRKAELEKSRIEMQRS
jgi:hypothetical protein